MIRRLVLALTAESIERSVQKFLRGHCDPASEPSGSADETKEPHRIDSTWGLGRDSRKDEQLLGIHGVDAYFLGTVGVCSLRGLRTAIFGGGLGMNAWSRAENG